MSKSWKRVETWLALIVLGVGAGLTLIIGLPMYMSATATPLHPVPSEVPSVAAPGPPGAWVSAKENSRQAIRAALTEQNLPGLSVAVGADGRLVWEEGFGWADLERRVPVTPRTRLRIGTASVPLTSAAVGLLLERDRLRLDDDIRRTVPQFPAQQPTVTLRQLMGHTAGIRNDGGDEGPLFSARCTRPADALTHFADRALLFEPGTQFRYSSYGWILVSAAVEAAAARPFLEFVRDEVLEPLGMDATGPDSTTAPDLATFYFPRFGSDPRYGLHLMRALDYSCYAGASVFLSTPSDLVRFGIGIARGVLLQPSTVRQLQTGGQLAAGSPTGYGLGWDVETVTLDSASTQAIGHDGSTLGGPIASFWMFPEHEIVVSVASNISFADTRTLAVQIAEAFASEKDAERTP